MPPRQRIIITIRTGEFDRYLVRPAGTLVQLLSRGVYVPTFGDLVTGLVMLVAAATRLNLDTSPGALLFLVLALAGGAMVEGAVQLAVASLSFRMLSTLSLRTLLDSLMNNFGGYPLKVFPDTAQFMLTFILPLAFVAYLPAPVLLDRTGDLRVSPWLAYGAPVAGPILLSLSYLLWRSQIRF
jgi:ABC-2 type transport system permease protein